MDPAALTALARHGEAIATVRAFAQAAQATRVVLLIDRGDETPALLVDADATGDTEITDGDAIALIPGQALVPAEPRVTPHVHAIPSTAMTIDPETAELHAPIGAIDQLARAVATLAGAFGGRTVATAEFATSDPQTPITIAAREGDPPLLEAGGEQFELPGL
jgi:hypothetical protein